MLKRFKPVLLSLLALLAVVFATVALADRTITCSSASVTVTSARLFRGADGGWSGEVCGFSRLTDGGVMRGGEGCAEFQEGGSFGNSAVVGRAALVTELCP